MIRNKYNLNIESSHFQQYMNTLKNKVYKLLPLNEEGADWHGYLTSILLEVSGAQSVFSDYSPMFIELVCKLESLFIAENFYTYRKTIFETLSFIDDFEVKINGCN